MLTFDNPKFSKLNSLEWLVTNGLGGYAACSLSGANTRRYHGALIAAMTPPTGRKVLVSKVEEEIIFENTTISLGTGQFPHQIIHPQGFRNLKSFERYPFPNMVYETEEVAISKSVFMEHGSNTTILKYQNLGKTEFTLQLMPLFVSRDDHKLFSAHHSFDFPYEQNDNYIKVQAKPDDTPVFVYFPNGKFSEDRDWYLNFEYYKEHDRGLDFKEDAYRLGYVQYVLEPGDKCYMVLSTTEELKYHDPQDLEEDEMTRMNYLSEDVQAGIERDLKIAANQFIVFRKTTESHTLIAGYPWFTDYGRDAMIALRGLCIIPGKKRIAKSILSTFMSCVDQGMLPNRFPDTGEEPEYNTIDATLWIFVAIWDYYQKFQDREFVFQCLPILTEILEWHIKGTRYGIKMEKSGLLGGGTSKTQLTWMDVDIEGDVITPRDGFPVEINALWYNAIMIYSAFVKDLKFDANQEIADKMDAILPGLRKTFRDTFVNKMGFLNDCVSFDGIPDESVMPNQVFALSLPFSLIGKKTGRNILDVIERDLFTPFGLRTLSKSDQDFHAEYLGGVWDRDGAYHRGTVWPYLLADYFIAMIRVYGLNSKTKDKMKACLDALTKHFYKDVCVHGISEVFDGKTPKHGKGAIQQAWSVSAMITLRDLLYNPDTHLKAILSL